MSKILKNTTASIVFVSDTGVPVPASGQYIIPPTDYPLWASSSDVIVNVGDGTLVVNDGSFDLSISDGIDLIKGLFPKKIAVGNEGLTQFATFIGDRLKVTDQDVLAILGTISAALGGSPDTVFKQNEAPVTSRNEFDLASTSFTIPAGKRLRAVFFAGSYDSQAALYVRLKKQTGGAGAFVTQLRLNMMSGGQGNSTLCLDLGSGVDIGVAGDVVKITIESSIAKGNIWAGFGGVLL